MRWMASIVAVGVLVGCSAPASSVGDRATDFSFYTKRLTLAGIHTATVLYWLEDRSEAFADTRAFLERRLAGVARVGKARQQLGTAVERLPNPLRLLRQFR